jgi:hypothetical protein
MRETIDRATAIAATADARLAPSLASSISKSAVSEKRSLGFSVFLEKTRPSSFGLLEAGFFVPEK